RAVAGPSVMVRLFLGVPGLYPEPVAAERRPGSAQGAVLIDRVERHPRSLIPRLVDHRELAVTQNAGAGMLLAAERPQDVKDVTDAGDLHFTMVAALGVGVAAIDGVAAAEVA